MRSLLALSVALMAVSPNLGFADQHCTCSKTCMAECKKGNGKNCDCKTCDCATSGKCDHDQCKMDHKDGHKH